MVTTAVETCPLKDLKAGPVFTHLDLGLLGESMGPDQQSRLRKRLNPDDNLLRKLIHGAMAGRGGQKNSAGECTVPAESEVVLCHISSDRSKMDCRSVFRPESARKDASPDAEEKEVIVAFDDESMRLRKKLSRGFAAVDSPFLLKVAVDSRRGAGEAV